MLPRLRIIRDYLLQLRKELVVLGLSEERVNEVLAETEAHFAEMAADIEATSEFNFQTMVGEFGPADTMAKNIAKEYERSDSTRRFLWPALFTGAMFGLMRLGAPWWLSPWIPQDLAYKGFLALCVIGFVVLGFLARKPSAGQFVVLGAILVVGGTALTAITSFPVGVYSGSDNGKGPSWYQSASRSNPDSFLKQEESDIAKAKLIVERMKVGKSVFVAKNEGQKVPDYLAYNGRYWKPEGLRELSLGIPPGRLGPSLSASTWAEAVQDWNGLEPSQAYNMADWNIKMAPNTIYGDRRTIASFYSSQSRPFMNQLRLDFQVEAAPALFACGCAFLITNGGWLLWLVVQALKCASRRMRYTNTSIAA